MKFNIGDRVQTKLNRTPGTVRWARDGMVAVETDNPNEGVPLRGFDIQRGLFLSADEWEKISPSKIVITSDGKTTLARLYDGNRVIRRAEAKRSPEDTYDFATGANLAYDRLMRPETLTASVKPQDKPRFKAGDKAKVIGNTCDHASKLGDIVTLENPYVPTAVEDSPAWDIKEDPYEYISERDLEPYAEPDKPAKEPVKLYCVKSHPGCLTKGKTYTIDSNGKMYWDFAPQGEGHYPSFADLERIQSQIKGFLVPLVSRPAKAGEWVLVNHISGDSGGISVGDIALVVMVNNGCGPYIRSKEKTIFGYNELGNVTLLKDDWCEVLDGYDGRYEPKEDELSNYEWVDGVKGMDADMTCMNNFQYEIGQTYDLGCEEINGSTSYYAGKGYHFCKTVDKVKKGTNYCDSDSRYFKVRGLVKKGSAGPVYCARKIEIVEEIKQKPKFYSGKVVCVDNNGDGGLTVGRVYPVANGAMCWDDNEEMARKFISVNDINKFFADETECTRAKFIEYKGEAT